MGEFFPLCWYKAFPLTVEVVTVERAGTLMDSHKISDFTQSELPP